MTKVLTLCLEQNNKAFSRDCKKTKNGQRKEREIVHDAVCHMHAFLALYFTIFEFKLKLYFILTFLSTCVSSFYVTDDKNGLKGNEKFSKFIRNYATN